jgi:hypothetical protein
MWISVRVIQDRLAEVEPHRASAIEAAYQHFRLDNQSSLVSPKTLRHCDGIIRPFLRWLDEEHPRVGRFEQLGLDPVREYREHNRGAGTPTSPCDRAPRSRVAPPQRARGDTPECGRSSQQRSELRR